MSHRDEPTRRTLLKAGAAAGSWAAASGLPFWSRLALAADETLVPFTDVPESFSAPPVTAGAVHWQDTRRIDRFYSPTEDFYVVQHYDQPALPADGFRLQVTGRVARPLSLTLEALQQRHRVVLDAGFECGGNSAGLFQGLVGNARWVGTPLRALLEDAGVQPDGIEVVFYGADKGVENVRDRDVEQHFGRSMHIEDALRPEVLLVWDMNGAPLNRYHGAPLRLLVPGWYGVANVKWLQQIHVQDRRYMGRFMARDYVTLSRRDVGGIERWEERSVTKMRLKSAIVRVVRTADGDHRITGFVLNDGTPLRSVEVKIDDGPWRQARIDPQSSTYSWKLFDYRWPDAAPGEHRIVSRVTDVNGTVQATPEEMPEKPSRWENHAQFPRTLRIG